MWEAYLKRGFSIIPIYGVNSEGQCQCGDPKCQSPGKHPKVSWKRFQQSCVSPQHAERWFQDRDTNIGIVTGKISNLVVVDEDEKGAADKFNLPETLTVLTSHGRRHFYFQHPGPEIDIPSGPLCKGIDIKGDGGFVVAPPSIHISGTIYKFEKETPIALLPENILDAIKVRRGDIGERPPVSFVEDIPEGQRDVTLTRLAGSLFGRGLGKEQVLALLYSHNQVHCDPPLSDRDVQKIVNGIYIDEKKKRFNYEEEDDSISQFRERSEPPQLHDDAYCGLVKEIIDTVDPYTEADPAAILLGLYTAFGNKVGRSPHFRTQQDKHHPNLYTIIVGESATARKGVAWSLVRDLITSPPTRQEGKGITVNFGEGKTWEPWFGGIASGEGLIELVKDDTLKYDPETKTKVIEEGTGVEDKRVLIYESEFASVLKKASHNTSIIWPVLRTLWDTGEARNSTKNSAIRTTGAHISILGNITEQELRYVFPVQELVSGTANRFLWGFVKRSKFLPQGKPVPEDKMLQLQKKIHDRVIFGQNVDECARDEEAEKLWEKFYISVHKSQVGGFLGSILDRADAQVLRLSLVTALLNGSTVIKKKHLEASIAIWDFVRHSVMYLFGEGTGHPLDNKVLNIIEQEGGQASRTLISKRLHSNYPARDLDASYQRLKDSGTIEEISLPWKNYKHKGIRPKAFQLVEKRSS